MRRIFFILVMALFVTFGLTSVFAESSIRAMGGVGKTSTSFDYSGKDLLNYHYGGQFVTHVAEKYAYGLEVMQYHAFSSDDGNYDYLSLCIVLEAKLFKIWLNQMGVAGYIGNGDNDLKPFGVRLSTGLDIPICKNFSIPVMWRSDFIFDEKNVFTTGIEVGASFNF